MSIEYMNWALGIQNLTPSENHILLIYAIHSDKTGKVWLSKDRIAHETGLSRNGIRKIIKSLVQKEIILKTKDKKGLTKNIPIYQLAEIKAHEKLSTEGAPQEPIPIFERVLPRSPFNHKLSTEGCYPGAPYDNGKGLPGGTSLLIEKDNIKEKNEEKASSSSSFSVHFSCSYIREKLQEMDLAFDEDIVDQIMFYAKKFEDKRPLKESARMAFTQLKKNKWNIPHGWRGITNQSIREKDEQHQREQEQRWYEEAKAARDVWKAVQGKGQTETAKIREMLREKLNANP